MYKLLGVSILFTLGLIKSDDLSLQRFPEVESTYPLIWKSETGNASFRTNVVFSGDQLIMGSNGERFRDYYFFDKGSGVCVVSRKTGQIIRRLANEPLGDMDVAGVLVKGDRVFFGNDNEEFQCMTLSGKLIWRIPVSGDVEHEPSEIDINGKKAVIFSTETGEIRAVEPENGKTIWTYYMPSFSGWKEGQNRTIFKIGAFFSNTSGFFTKPELVDLNKDGVKDLIFLGYYTDIYAINGKTGKPLWVFNDSSRRHYFMLSVLTVKGEPHIKFFEYQSTDGESLTYLTTLNKSGKTIEQIPILASISHDGINSQMTDHKLLITTEDALWVIQPGKEIIKIDRTITYKYINYNKDTVTSTRNGYDPVIGSGFFEHPEYGKCVVVLNQADVTYDKGFIEIISLDQQKLVQTFTIPARSEMPPIIEDVNRDGKMDLLINTYDGFTYCYSLTSKK